MDPYGAATKRSPYCMHFEIASPGNPGSPQRGSLGAMTELDIITSLTFPKQRTGARPQHHRPGKSGHFLPLFSSERYLSSNGYQGLQCTHELYNGKDFITSRKNISAKRS